MQNRNIFTFIIILIVCTSCLSQSEDALVIENKKIVIFRLSEEEFLIRSNENQGFYELDSDFSTILGLLKDELDKRGLSYMMTTKKHIKFLSSEEEFHINLDSIGAFYGVIFYDGQSNPVVSVGAYPLEYYIEILDK